MLKSKQPSKRIFSGIQPTGNLHIGNYLGAIKNWINLQEEDDCIYSIVDLHAMTVPNNLLDIKNSTLEVAAAVIASGIDPKKSILFNQSNVPQHTELAWIFNCIAKIGWLNRMTQFKEKAGKKKIMLLSAYLVIQYLWQQIFYYIELHTFQLVRIKNNI